MCNPLLGVGVPGHASNAIQDGMMAANRLCSSTAVMFLLESQQQTMFSHHGYQVEARQLLIV